MPICPHTHMPRSDIGAYARGHRGIFYRVGERMLPGPVRSGRLLYDIGGY